MPRRFQFRLQPVLEQRERIEQEQQRRVAEIESERLRHEQTLRTIQAELAQARDGLRARLQQPGAEAGFASVRWQANASLHTTIRAQRAAIELAGTLRRLESARAELLKATADRKAVQMLKDKRYAEFQTEMRRRESGELDELMVMRHGMNAQSLELADAIGVEHP